MHLFHKWGDITALKDTLRVWKCFKCGLIKHVGEALRGK